MVKTTLSLDEAQTLFKEFSLTRIEATSSGIIDTTYIAHSKQKGFILKKYERDIADLVQEDAKRLQRLHEKGLNVSTLLAQNGKWFLYKRLQGTQPTNINLRHIHSLARFMAKFHQESQFLESKVNFIESCNIKDSLKSIKKEFYFYYKKLQFLQEYSTKTDGFIHGDIFKDNTVFDGHRVGVFDFIDSGCGSFTLDIAVALVAFDGREHPMYIRAFLNTYNQKAPKKVAYKELKKNMRIASSLYGLLRIQHHKNTKLAKELL